MTRDSDAMTRDYGAMTRGLHVMKAQLSMRLQRRFALPLFGRGSLVRFPYLIVLAQVCPLTRAGPN